LIRLLIASRSQHYGFAIRKRQSSRDVRSRNTTGEDGGKPPGKKAGGRGRMSTGGDGGPAPKKARMSTWRGAVAAPDEAATEFLVGEVRECLAG